MERREDAGKRPFGATAPSVSIVRSSARSIAKRVKIESTVTICTCGWRPRAGVCKIVHQVPGTRFCTYIYVAVHATGWCHFQQSITHRCSRSFLAATP
jgi:hypothetical protein